MEIRFLIAMAVIFVLLFSVCGCDKFKQKENNAEIFQLKEKEILAEIDKSQAEQDKKRETIALRDIDWLQQKKSESKSGGWAARLCPKGVFHFDDFPSRGLVQKNFASGIEKLYPHGMGLKNVLFCEWELKKESTTKIHIVVRYASPSGNFELFRNTGELIEED